MSTTCELVSRFLNTHRHLICPDSDHREPHWVRSRKRHTRRQRAAWQARQKPFAMPLFAPILPHQPPSVPHMESFVGQQPPRIHHLESSLPQQPPISVPHLEFFIGQQPPSIPHLASSLPQQPPSVPHLASSLQQQPPSVPHLASSLPQQPPSLSHMASSLPTEPLSVPQDESNALRQPPNVSQQESIVPEQPPSVLQLESSIPRQPPSQLMPDLSHSKPSVPQLELNIPPLLSTVLPKADPFIAAVDDLVNCLREAITIPPILPPTNDGDTAIYKDVLESRRLLNAMTSKCDILAQSTSTPTTKRRTKRLTTKTAASPVYRTMSTRQ